LPARLHAGKRIAALQSEQSADLHPVLADFPTTTAADSPFWIPDFLENCHPDLSEWRLLKENLPGE